MQSVGYPLTPGAWAFSPHAVHIFSPAIENVSGAHGIQFEMESDAFVGEKYPGPHGEHSFVPSMGL